MDRKRGDKIVKSVEVIEAQESLARYVGQAAAGPIVLMSDGRPVAALVSLKNVDLESFLLSSNPKFISILEESSERQQREGGISVDEIRRRLKVARKSATRQKVRKRAIP